MAAGDVPVRGATAERAELWSNGADRYRPDKRESNESNADGPAGHVNSLSAHRSAARDYAVGRCISHGYCDDHANMVNG